MIADGHIGTILTVVGFGILVMGSIKYGSDIFTRLQKQRAPAGAPEDSVFIGAVSTCQGLTGATLTACQKARAQQLAQNKPTGYGQAGSGGGVRRPVTIRGPITPTNLRKRCIDRDGVWRNGRCISKQYAGITPTNRNFNALRITTIMRCSARARALYLPYMQQALLNLARSKGYRTTRELLNNLDKGGLFWQMQQVANRYQVAINNHAKSCIRAAGFSTVAKEPMSAFDPHTGSRMGFNYAV